MSIYVIFELHIADILVGLKGIAGALHFRSRPFNWHPTTSRTRKTYPFFDFNIERYWQVCLHITRE